MGKSKATCTADLQESISKIERNCEPVSRSKVLVQQVSQETFIRVRIICRNYTDRMDVLISRVNFSDKDREINVPLNILVG